MWTKYSITLVHMIPARAPRSRSWLGTLNNYTDAELELLKAHECRYMALGFHVGLKSHLPHVHIDVEYKTMKTRPKFLARIHWEVRRGTLKQALDYLNKDDKLEERGDRPRLDNRIATTFEEHYLEATKGIVHPESQMYARNRSYFDQIANAARPPYIFNGELDTKNLWIVGPAGCGKSAFVRKAAIAEGKSLFDKPMNKWWDGYKGQDYVLMDDISPDICVYLKDHLKRWADRYDFTAEVKGSSVRIDPSFRLVITSQYRPDQCFDSVYLEAIARRFEVWQFASGPNLVAVPPRCSNPTPPCSQTYESMTLSSSWN